MARGARSLRRHAKLRSIDTTEWQEHQAAQKQVDPDRLLPGEDPTTPHPEEAQHWTSVYGELVSFKERIVNTARQAVSEAWQQEVSRELAATDLVALEAELARLRRRLEFWRQRVEERERR
jgi:CO/xanthine dehydrogenase Mo-binding subunit